MTRPFTYGSICSGIEAASVAWHPLGWRPAFFAEIDPAPSRVLAHRFPEVPNHGDFTRIGRDGGPAGGAIDLLVGGTPCQSFSIAGLRGGLDDSRGNLSLEFCRLAERLRPRWLVWENVPGVLSSGGGRDFGAILGGLAELGYGLAWRVLDAQYVRVDGLERAVPQRRRRVFVVGYCGDWRRAAEVLLEPEGLRGDPPPRREARQDVAGTPGSRATAGGGLGTDVEPGGLFPQVSLCLNAGGMGRIDAETETLIPAPPAGGGFDVAHALKAEGFDANEDGTGRGVPLVTYYRTSGNSGSWATGNSTDALTTSSDPFSHVLAFDTTQITGAKNRSAPQAGAPAHPLAAKSHPPLAFDMRGRDGGAMPEGPHDTANIRAASGGSSRSYIAAASPRWAVRRLMPVECERLQGFPDGWTDAPDARGRPMADGPRYRMLGNSMAVNVMRWIGWRITEVEKRMAGRVAP